MKKLYLFILSFIFIPALLAAEVPASYYSSVNGLADKDLKNALSKLIYNHTTVSSYNALPEYFKQTDVYPGTNIWWDMYSDVPVTTNGTFGSHMNREHSFPKSWWGGGENTPAYIDLNHLYPSEKNANMAKSNFPLGEVQSSTFDNGVVKVGYPVTGQGGGSAKVFEPDDEYKGDFARTYFYMVTCYQNLTWTPKYMYMLRQDLYPTLKDWAIDLLLKWNRQDPVSDKETDRNETVYKIQNNRNPFIDMPELAEYIWGNKIGQKFYVGQSPSGDPELITPVQDMSLDFGQTAIGSEVVSRLYFKGENLTGRLSITLSGTDKSMFSIPSSSITSSLVNSDDGYYLPVTYKPTALGSHSARLIISDGGLTGSRGIALVGECLQVPTLSTITALPASDITADSYVANWEEPAETIDYYIVTRTRYTGGSSSSEDIIAESNSLLIEDFGTSESESYNVRSVRLGYESPRSNEIFVMHAGITGVNADVPFGWAYYPGGIRFVCGSPHSNGRIYNIAGQLLMTIPEITNNMVISLPSGAYIILTDQSSSPLKVLISQ